MPGEMCCLDGLLPGSSLAELLPRPVPNARWCNLMGMWVVLSDVTLLPPIHVSTQRVGVPGLKPGVPGCWHPLQQAAWHAQHIQQHAAHTNPTRGGRACLQTHPNTQRISSPTKIRACRYQPLDDVSRDGTGCRWHQTLLGCAGGALLARTAAATGTSSTRSTTSTACQAALHA